MSDRSSDIYGMAHASIEKFDYFICGVTGALFAYLSQTYQPHKIEDAFSILQISSLLLLAVSFYAGIKRIQFFILMTRINHEFLSASEAAGKITTSLFEYPGANVFHNQGSGELKKPDDLERKREDDLRRAKELEASFPLVRRKAIRYGRVRETFLLLGFLTILVSKVAQPYQRDFPPPSRAIPPATNAPTQSTLPALGRTNK
jgi:hypothetical protein